MEFQKMNKTVGLDLPGDDVTISGCLLSERNPEQKAPSCSLSKQCSAGWGLATYPLAMVYSPCQGFQSLYDPETALVRGTLFSELDLPFEGNDNGARRSCGCGCGL